MNVKINKRLVVIVFKELSRNILMARILFLNVFHKFKLNI